MSIKDLDPSQPTSTGLAGLGDDEFRALKQALVNCFPELEGLISNNSGVGTNPPDAATFTDLFTRLETVEASVGGAAVVPVGVVCMWAGVLTISYGDGGPPAGWALCDGGIYNGQQTPDLRSRFIVGGALSADAATRFMPGDTGGNAWLSQGDNSVMDTAQGGGGTGNATLTIPDHVITEANIPDHFHFMSFDNPSGFESGGGATNTRGIKSNWPNSSGDGYSLRETDDIYDNEEPNVGKTSTYGGTGTPAPLTHEAADIEIEDIQHEHNYSPLYHSMAYIMYVGVAP